MIVQCKTFEGSANNIDPCTLPNMSGMQRELLHLEQLEERSAPVASEKNAAVLPVDYRPFCFLFWSRMVLICADYGKSPCEDHFAGQGVRFDVYRIFFDAAVQLMPTVR